MTGREVIFYGPIGEAVEQVAPAMGVDPIGIYTACLSMWSMAISDKVFMDPRRKRSPLVSTVLVAGTGVGKNQVLQGGRHVMEDSIGVDVKIRETGAITSGAALVDYLHDQMESTEEASGYPDKRVLVLDEEWKETLITVARDRSYGSKIRQAWDCETLRNTNKRKSNNDRPQVVHGARVVFHCHITPEDWTQYVSFKEAAGGSFNRYLPVLIQEMPLVRRPAMPEVDTSDLVAAFDWIRGGEHVMRLSKDADHLDWILRRAERILLKSLPPHQNVYLSRSAEQVRRVAALLACSVGETRISLDHMHAAISFVGYSVDSVLTLTRDMPGRGRPKSKPEERVIAELTAHPGGIPSAKLQRMTGAHAADLDHMAHEGLITIDVIKDGPGRPTRLCRLNKGSRKPAAGAPMSSGSNPFLQALGL